MVIQPDCFVGAVPTFCVDPGGGNDSMSLQQFVRENRLELIRRTRAKVASRPSPQPSEAEMEDGVPLFLSELVTELREEEERRRSGGGAEEERRRSGSRRRTRRGEPSLESEHCKERYPAWSEPAQIGIHH
jgi:hypothetical protein